MFKMILKKMDKDNRGFTLIELVVVIAILGILAGIAVPKLSSSRTKAAIAAHNANVRTLQGVANMYIADDGLPKFEEDQKEIVWGYILESDEPKMNVIGEDDDDYGWGDYLQEWPDVPKGLPEPEEDENKAGYHYKKNESGLEGYYTLTIDEDGNIDVLPSMINEKNEDDEE